MKRILTLGLVCALAVSLLAACSGKKADGDDVDLDACYAQMLKDADFGDGYMETTEGEMLDSFYPGLSDIPAKKLIAAAPLMSGVVNEVVLMQCETEDDAANAAAILQERVDSQANGGAWYPESMDAWSRAQVIQHGAYVAMIASADYQDTWAADFESLFA